MLVVHSFGREFEPYKTFSENFRLVLAQQSPERLDISDVALSSALFDDGVEDSPFVEYLHTLYSRRQPDLIVSIGGPAAKFTQRTRQRLFETSPILYTGVDQRFVEEATLTPNDAVVALKLDAALAVENILQVLPSTATIAVVMGASPLERYWVEEVRRLVQGMTNRVQFVWCNELPFEKIRASVAKMPPHSAIFYGDFSVDVSGIPYEEGRALMDLRTTANAPVFGFHDYQLGLGVVGGALLPLAESSREAALVAVRILRGERAGTIKTEVLAAGTPVYDWRELKRWGITKANLPEGSEVRFRQPGYWRQHGWKIFLVTSVVLVQAGIILLLLRNRAKRLCVEHALRESEARFRTVANAAPVMIWMSSRDKLCTFFNKSWLDFTGRTMETEVGNGWAEGVHEDDLQSCLKIYTSAFDERKSFTMEYRLRRQDGEYRWISDTGVPRYDDSGRFAGYIGSCLDITDRRKSERTSHELSGRLIRAQEDERARLARELHDDITQRLARLAIDAGVAERDGGTAALIVAMRGVREGLVRVSEDVHGLSYRLHPQMLEELGLTAALKAECERFSRRESVSAELRTHGLQEPMTMDVSLCLFRVTQEALRNVGRHAHAQRVEVVVRPLEGGVQLAVRDDGVGFNPAVGHGRATLGQASMRERVNLLGGEFDVESAPGHGTTVLAWVPVNGGHE